MPVDKIANPAAAAGAYASSAKTARTPGMGQDDTSFLDLIKNSASSAVQTLKAGEAAQAQAVSGASSLTEVVEAVTAAELTLQSVVAIRDRMLNAYQDIMRMPI